jgi:hypothetical protein
VEAEGLKQALRYSQTATVRFVSGSGRLLFSAGMPFRSIHLRVATRIIILAFAGLFQSPAARPNDCLAEEGEFDCAVAAEKETGRDCYGDKKEGSEQTCANPEEWKKHNLFRSWLHMAAETQARQPDWLSPLATTSGRLKNEFRYDLWDQPSTQGNRTYQLGGGKGLEFITSSRTQLLAGIPTYTLHSPNGAPSGFGDVPLMLKFRIASAERGEGNYLVTFILAATAPTGAHRYGAGDGVVTPTLALGKGFGRFDVQSTFGANLPTGQTAKLGRPLQWNTAFQYQAAWKLWPELEVNSTFYKTGASAGNRQVFLTPGLGFGRMRLGRGFRFSTAAGIQIAVTRFHAYDHRWMFSERISF